MALPLSRCQGGKFVEPLLSCQMIVPLHPYCNPHDKSRITWPRDIRVPRKPRASVDSSHLGNLLARPCSTVLTNLAFLLLNKFKLQGEHTVFEQLPSQACWQEFGKDVGDSQ